MVKAPTKHGLENKFKSWRKGKSEKSNKRSSLKQQLRGLERLLSKLNKADAGGEDGNNDIEQRRVELQTKIQTLKQEIDGKQHQLLCKKHAEKSHGPRFMDRQKLTRQEKQVRGQRVCGTESSPSTKDQQQAEKETMLFKLALDQAYVAHHPTDVKYIPLYKKGRRVIDQSRQLYRRAVTRKRILKGLASSESCNKQTNEDDQGRSKSAAAAAASSLVSAAGSDRWERVNWISSDLYDRLPTDWTIQDEERVFGGSISRSKKDNVTPKQRQEGLKTLNDNRFAMQSSHEAMITAAERFEAEFDEEKDGKQQVEQEQEQEQGDEKNIDHTDNEHRSINLTEQNKDGCTKRKINDDSDSESSDSSSDNDADDDDGDENLDEVDPLVRRQVQVSKKVETQKDSQHTETIGDSDDDNDSSSSSSDSSSDTDSSSDGNDDDDDRRNEKTNRSTLDIDNDDSNSDDDEVDDFLVDAADEDEGDGNKPINVFERHTTSQIPAWGEARGDKSRGWETQRQRPGEFKRKRTRR
jgi:rRNA-processing protein Efg1